MSVASGVVFPPLCSPASSKLQSLPSPVTHYNLSYSSSSSAPLFGGLFTSLRHRDVDLINSRRLGGVYASQRGFRKVRGRPSARKKHKGKELELDVKICIEEQLPDDHEILGTFLTVDSVGRVEKPSSIKKLIHLVWQDIAEMLRLNVPMAMKLAFDGLKDSDHKTRDPTINDVGQYESIELSILLCNDEFIRELNKDWRNEDHATDVLSMSQHVPELKLPMARTSTIIYSYILK